MSEALTQLKRELIESHRLWAVSNPDEAKVQSEKLAQGLRDIPIRQMLDQLQYIETQLLPSVKKRGKKEDIDFFESLCRSLAHAIVLADRYEYLYGRLINLRIDVALLRDHLQLAEKELERYTTMEDLLLSDAHNKYAEAIAARVKRDILTAKKK